MSGTCLRRCFRPEIVKLKSGICDRISGNFRNRKGHDVYGDLYYTIPAGKTSAEALNDFRPNAEQVSIRVVGTDAEHPTVIGGAIYCGGNSATLKTVKAKPMVELKIGSHVIADTVFLGNNGENMIKYNEAGVETTEGVLRTMSRTDIASDGTKFNSMDLTNKSQFAAYMDGVAMGLMPRVVFDDINEYVPYSTMFGSFYCGGNVGSMTSAGKTVIDFVQEVVVYDKVVGGCNNAFVTPSDYNALFEGGLTGAPDGDGNKLELNFDGLKIQPKRWKMNGNNYALDTNGNRILEWNTISSATGLNVAPITSGATPESPVTSTEADIDRRLKGGNIYGGCYNSGIVNGNIIINIGASVVDRDLVFDEVEGDEQGERKLYDNDEFKITKRNTGVILDEQGMDGHEHGAFAPLGYEHGRQGSL